MNFRRQGLNIILPKREQEKLLQHVVSCISDAQDAHDTRMQRFRRLYQRWRRRRLEEDKGADPKGYEPPVLTATVIGKMSALAEAMIGNEAQIVAQPTTPTDVSLCKKVGLYATFIFFSYMRAVPALCVCLFRAILFGRAHAYRAWEDDGPRPGMSLIPIWPDDLIVPGGENPPDLEGFSWVARVFRETPQALLDGERKNRYFNITENWKLIRAWAYRSVRDDTEEENVQIAADEAQGVTTGTVSEAQGTIRGYEWYGRWRMPANKAGIGSDLCSDDREMDERRVLVRVLKHPQIVITVALLDEVFPKLEKKIPIWDLAMFHDGTYWGPSIGEAAEVNEEEIGAIHRLFTDTAEYAAVGILLAKPSVAKVLTDEKTKARPREIVWTEDPAGARHIQTGGDLSGLIAKEQAVWGYNERETGVTDLSSGRQPDRPNAPKTVGQTVALIESSNTRTNLDSLAIRMGFEELLSHMWELETLNRPATNPSMFFRVTEEQAAGAFKVVSGGSVMDKQELQGSFDFSLKIAPTKAQKQLQREGVLQNVTIALGTLLIQQNPAAQWRLLDTLWRAAGDTSFRDICEQPPEIDASLNPKEEFAKLIAGEMISVHPGDNDEHHIQEHTLQMEQLSHMKDLSMAEEIGRKLALHNADHFSQKRQKAAMQAMVQQIGAGMQQAVATAAQATGGMNGQAGNQNGSGNAPDMEG